jgi:osmotically inducible protein OsmC
MALSAELGKTGMRPDRIETSAAVSLEKLDLGWTVTQVHLEVRAKVPGADKTAFDAAADIAKKNCPISRLLNAKITMNATLEA